MKFITKNIYVDRYYFDIDEDNASFSCIVYKSFNIITNDINKSKYDLSNIYYELFTKNNNFRKDVDIILLHFYNKLKSFSNDEHWIAYEKYF
jgi:hypothetical protein